MNATQADSVVEWRVGTQEQQYFSLNTHNLQLHRLALQLNRPDLEVNADGAQVAVREGILREPQKET